MQDRGVTCQLRAPNNSRLSRGARKRATMFAVSREEAQHASLTSAHTMPRSEWLTHDLQKSAALPTGLSPSAQDRGATCQLRPQNHSRLSRGERKRPLCSLSLGRRRISRACRTRAAYRARRGGFMPYETPPHRREASLLWCKTVVRRSSCELTTHTAGSQVTCPGAQLCSLSLGKGAALELVARALRAALVAVSIRLTKIHYAGERHLPFGERPWCDAPAASSQHTVGCRVARAGVRLRSLSLGKRRSTRACRARTPCRAGRGWHTPNESPLHRREASPLLCKTVV